MSLKVKPDLFVANQGEIPRSFPYCRPQNGFPDPLEDRLTSYSVSIQENELLDENQNTAQDRSFYKIALFCLAIFASMGLIKYAHAWADPEDGMGPLNSESEETFSNVFSASLEPVASASQLALSAVTSMSLQSMGRHLLQAVGPTIQSYVGQQLLTEEVSHLSTWNIPDVFKTAGGPLSISARQIPNLPLPQGMSLINQGMQVVSSYTLAGCTDIIYRDNYALIGTTNGLKIFDVSGGTPNLVSSGDIARIDTMVVEGNTCYTLSATISNGGDTIWTINTIDITNILSPITIGTVKSTSSTTGKFQLYNNLFVSNGFCYVAGAEAIGGAASTGALFIFDMRNPTNITQASSISFPLSQSFDSVIVDSGFCYASVLGCLYVIDVRNPNSPAIIGNLTLPPNESIFDMKIANDLCYAATDDGLKIIDISNFALLSIIGSYGIGSVMHNVQISGESCFVTSTGPYIQNIDIRNPAAPILSAFMVTTGIAASLAISPTNSLFIDYSGLRVGTLADTFVLKGTPGGGTQGNYTISLTAKDSKAASITQLFNLQILPAITITGAFPVQKAVVGENFNYFVQAFSHVNNAALTYTAKLINSTALPRWLSLSAATGQFFGTPSDADVGEFDLIIMAQDSVGASASLTAQIGVYNTPSLANPILDQNVPIATVGNLFEYVVPAGTFSSKTANPLTYSAKHGDLELPSWLTFNATSMTFSGIPSVTDQGSLPIKITAQDLTNIPITTSFNIHVDIETAPVIGASLVNPSIQIGSKLEYAIPKDTFISSYASKITYSATSGDGTPLPEWLTFDPDLGIFSGTPSRSDMRFYEDGLVSVSLTGKGIKATQTTTFNINIQGTSFGEIVLAAAAPLGSVFAALLAVPEVCVLAWNRFFKKKFIQQNQIATVGQEYKSSPISIPWKEIKKFTTLVNGQEIAEGNLPSWLEYDPENNILKSRSVVPNITVIETYTIQVFRRCGKYFKHTGRIMEELTIEIKGADKSTRIIEMHALASPTKANISSSAGKEYEVQGEVSIPMFIKTNLPPVRAASRKIHPSA